MLYHIKWKPHINVIRITHNQMILVMYTENISISRKNASRSVCLVDRGRNPSGMGGNPLLEQVGKMCINDTHKTAIQDSFTPEHSVVGCHSV
jgi:hypothetical protein